MIPQSEALSLKKLNISPESSGHTSCFHEVKGKAGWVRVGTQRYRSIDAEPTDLSASLTKEEYTYRVNIHRSMHRTSVRFRVRFFAVGPERGPPARGTRRVRAGRWSRPPSRAQRRCAASCALSVGVLRDHSIAVSVKPQRGLPLVLVKRWELTNGKSHKVRYRPACVVRNMEAR